MMYSSLLKGELENRRLGYTISLMVNIALVAMLFLAKCTNVPAPLEPLVEPGGILVNLGQPDQGQGDENAPSGEPSAGEPEPEVSEPEPEPEPETPPPAKPEKPIKEETKKPEKTKPDPTPPKKTQTTEDPDAIALKKKQETERKQKEAADKAAKDTAAKAQKEKDAATKAASDKKAADAKKKKELEDQIAGGLGGGKGKGKGDTGKPGNQGDPNGDPNADNLSGIAGGGSIGGALGNRGVASRPGNFKHNCPETGKVVVRVCADEAGTVISAEFTQSGSTVSATCNKTQAINHAKKYKFKKGDRTECGTITYNFGEQ